MKNFNTFLKKIGMRIKEERQKSSLRQEDFDSHDTYKVEHKWFQKIESGQINITMKTLYKIAKRLKVDPKDLLDFSNKK